MRENLKKDTTKETVGLVALTVILSVVFLGIPILEHNSKPEIIEET